MTWLSILFKNLAADKVLAGTKFRAAMFLLALLALLFGYWLFFRISREPTILVNVAYDGSRTYFETIDAAFSRHAPDATKAITSYAGSVKQARALSDGMVAEIVCLSNSYELDTITKGRGCMDPNWRQRFPFGSSPFTSTIVLVVRKGNPRAIESLESLHRKDIATLIPSPRISGAGVYAFLTILKNAMERNHGDESAASRELLDLYLRAHFPEAGAYQLSEQFVRENQADVLVTWESEAIRIRDHLGPGEFDIVYPAISLLAEPVVNLLDCHVDERGNRQAAMEYIQFLFSLNGQELAASAGLRPRHEAVALAYAYKFPQLQLPTIEEAFGSWAEIQSKHFGTGGTFDKIRLMRAARAGGIE